MSTCSAREDHLAQPITAKIQYRKLARWRFPFLNIHSEQNTLQDRISTCYMLQPAIFPSQEKDMQHIH